MERRAAGSGGRSRWAVAAAVVTALAAIYVVPLHIPMRAGISEAYMFGFNTRAAIVVIFYAMAGFAVWSKGLGLSLDVGERRLSRGLLWGTLLVSSVAMVGVWWVLRRLGPANEGLYFADRYQMFHSGARPYKDFEFAYGPLMFYLPVWIRAIVPISFTDSYYAAGLLEWMAGVVVLWKAVRMAGGGRWVYLLVWGFFAVSIADGAPLYGPLRFASGVLLALLVGRLWMRRDSALPGFGLAAAGFVVLLSYSPEQGIAFGLATFFYCLNFRAKRDWLLGVGLFVGMDAIALVAANRMGVLDTMKAYADGGGALPLVVSPVSLSVLVLMMVAACAAWKSLREGERENPLLYVLLVSACCAPAAFSRCFGAAMAGQMLGAVLVGLIVLRRYEWPWRVGACGFLLLVVGVAARDQVRLCRPIVHTALHPAEVYDYPAPGKGYLVRAPLGWDQKTFEPGGEWHVLSGRYAYYEPLLKTNVPAEKIAELEADPKAPLLLPMGADCVQDDSTRRRRLMAMLDAIYLPRIKHEVTTGQALCDYIYGHYRGSDVMPDEGYLGYGRVDQDR